MLGHGGIDRAHLGKPGLKVLERLPQLFVTAVHSFESCAA
jgi:hypothetical protein